jgi:hypothetical protein
MSASPSELRPNEPLKWLETSTARAGIAFGNILIYAKGGLAVGNFDVSVAVPVGNQVRR